MFLLPLITILPISIFSSYLLIRAVWGFNHECAIVNWRLYAGILTGAVGTVIAILISLLNLARIYRYFAGLTEYQDRIFLYVFVIYGIPCIISFVVNTVLAKVYCQKDLGSRVAIYLLIVFAWTVTLGNSLMALQLARLSNYVNRVMIMITPSRSRIRI